MKRVNETNLREVPKGLFVQSELRLCDEDIMVLLDRLEGFDMVDIIDNVPSLALVQRWLLDFGICVETNRVINLRKETMYGVTGSKGLYLDIDEALRIGILLALRDDELLKENGLLREVGLRKIEIKYKGGDIQVPSDDVLHSGGLTIIDHRVTVNLKVREIAGSDTEKVSLTYEFELDRRGYEIDMESNSIVLHIPNLGDIIKD